MTDQPPRHGPLGARSHRKPATRVRSGGERCEHDCPKVLDEPRTLTWTAAEVTKDGSVTYKVTIATGADQLAQPLTNTATIKSDETPPDSATADIFVAAPPKEITQPPTDTFPARQQPANPGFSLMLLLLGLAGFALALGFVTPVPERARRRDRD